MQHPAVLAAAAAMHAAAASRSHTQRGAAVAAAVQLHQPAHLLHLAAPHSCLHCHQCVCNAQPRLRLLLGLHSRFSPAATPNPPTQRRPQTSGEQQKLYLYSSQNDMKVPGGPESMQGAAFLGCCSRVCPRPRSFPTTTQLPNNQTQLNHSPVAGGSALIGRKKRCRLLLPVHLCAGLLLATLAASGCN
jgi:hypothetical protein